MAAAADRVAFSVARAPRRVGEYPATMWPTEQARPASTSSPSGVSIALTSVVVDPHTFDVPLDVDAAELAQFDCPTYDEAAAVDLDGVEIVEEAEQHCSRGLVVTNGLETSFQSLLNFDVVVYMPPIQFDLEATAAINESSDTQQAGEGNEAGCDDPRRRCTYRKGRCSAPRTYKKNGEMHSFCALHRLRSIANQKNFDKKRRARTHNEAGDSCGATAQGSQRSRRRRHPRRRSDAGCEQNALQNDENGAKIDMSFFDHLGQVKPCEGSSSSDNSHSVSEREPMWSIVL